MTLIIDRVWHAYGQRQILSDFSLTVSRGEIVCLLGPSGCGKSTLLRLIAGIDRLQGGRISINDTVLADRTRMLPAEKRPVGLVFQDGALFPHMSVAGNVDFGMRRLPETVRKARRSRLLRLVGLEHLAERSPATLSGGEQQRIALARAMAPNPDILLMDEPYASIDVVLRRSLREEARLLLKEENAAVILVTHDPQEALEMADRIAVMSDGTILQEGPPEEILRSPVDIRVASLFGGAQTLRAQPAHPDGFTTAAGHVACSPQRLAGLLTDMPCDLVITPSALAFTPDKDGDAVVRDVRREPSTTLLYVGTPAGAARDVVRVNAGSGPLPEPGTKGTLSLTDDHGFVFPVTGG